METGAFGRLEQEKTERYWYNYMRAGFHTLGCKVNQYETEALKERFAAEGYDIVTEGEPADVYIINTCTVTHLADRKSRQFIRRARKQNPDCKVIVTGCYAQMSPDAVASIEGVDRVMSNADKRRIVEEAGAITAMESRTRAYLKVEDGCDRFCSYCVIPYARGPVRSRPLAEIVAEAETLIGNGFRELILTGINTALYGADKELPAEQQASQKCGIADVIAVINELPGDFRIRLSSLEPTVINADFVKTLFAYDKLCHHLHLSAQSGSSCVLRRMNRHYDRAEYLKMVEVLQDFDPCYGITTDLIAGFPAETEAEFADSISLIGEAGFCRVHAFPYSKREGTTAAGMQQQISDREKAARTAALIAAGSRASRAFAQRCAGSIQRVLIEEHLAAQKLYAGYAGNYLRVYIEEDERIHISINQFADVCIAEPYRDGAKGIIQEEKGERNDR